MRGSIGFTLEDGAAFEKLWRFEVFFGKFIDGRGVGDDSVSGCTLGSGLSGKN